MTAVELPDRSTDDGGTVASTPSAPRPHRQRRSLLSGRAGKRLQRNRMAMASLTYLVILAIVAIAAPLIMPHDPTLQDLTQRFQNPSGTHWFGTDGLGRDVLSRLIDAAGIALASTLLAVGIAVAVGATLGVVAGYVGGFFDGVVSRLIDALMSLPPLILAIAIVGILGPGLTNAMLAIGVLLVPTFYRVVRGATMTVRGATYVESARASGCSTSRILTRHVLPMISSPLLVQISFAAGIALVAEASLSFLGLGVQPPQASWGSMLSEAFTDVSRNSFLVVPPTVAIALTILALSTLGDGLRDAFGRQTEGAR
jgi:peptide/nickel transport system permease protein